MFFSPEQAHQLHRVLRLRAGDQVIALDGAGVEYAVTLLEVTSRRALGQITAQRPSPGEPALQITLFQSLLKRDKFETVLQKGTEVGVTRFIPLVTQHSLVQDTQLKANKTARWQKIIVEAAEQAQRGRLPQLDPPRRFAEALDAAPNFDLALLAAVGAQTPLRTLLTSQPQPPASIALFIGPEGGFTPDEVALAEENGIRPFTLGPRILRTETAALTAAALILYEFDEMI